MNGNTPSGLSQILNKKKEQITSFSISAGYINLIYTEGETEKIPFKNHEITENRDFFWNRIQKKLENFPHIKDNPNNRALAHLCYEAPGLVDSILQEQFNVIPGSQGEIFINRIGTGIFEHVTHAEDIREHTPPKIVKK